MDRKIPYLDKIINIITTTVDPDKIILFGSHARGDYNEKSDIDLLILKKGIKNEREITGNLYVKFYDEKIKTPIDLIAMDADKYNELTDDIGYIYKTINQEGIVLYEQL